MSYQCQCYVFNASIARLQVMCDLLIEGSCSRVDYRFSNQSQWFSIGVFFFGCFVLFLRFQRQAVVVISFQNSMRAIHAFYHYYYFMIRNWMACYQIYSTHFHLKLNFGEIRFFVYSITIYLPFFSRESIYLVHLTFVVELETGGT